MKTLTTSQRERLIELRSKIEAPCVQAKTLYISGRNGELNIIATHLDNALNGVRRMLREDTDAHDKR